MIVASIEVVVPAEGSTVVLVGNPNVGKSVLFGALTGTYVTVSNYPGTTVEMTSGRARLGGPARPGRGHAGDGSLASALRGRARDPRRPPLRRGARRRRGGRRQEPGAHRPPGAPGGRDRPPLRPLPEHDGRGGGARGITIDVAVLGERLGVAGRPHRGRAARGPGAAAAALCDRAAGVTRASPIPEPVERAVDALACPSSRLRGLSLARPGASCPRRRRRRCTRWPARARCRRAPRRLEVVAAAPGPRAAGAASATSIHQARLRAAARDRAGGRHAAAASGRGGRGRRADRLEPRDHASRSGAARSSPSCSTSRLSLRRACSARARWSASSRTACSEASINPPATAVGQRGVPWALRPRPARRPVRRRSRWRSPTRSPSCFPIVGTFFLAFGVLEDSGYLPRLAVMVNRSSSDGAERQGRAADGARPGLRHDGDPDHAHPGDAEGADDRHPAAGARRALLGAAHRRPHDARPLSPARHRDLGRSSSSPSSCWSAAGRGGSSPGRGSDFVLELPPLRVPRLGNIVGQDARPASSGT